MVGIAATILPTRALQGWFAGVPVFYESNVILVNKKSNAHNINDLSRSKFAVLQGSSQQASGTVLFPKASFKALATESDAATEVAVGRADAAIFSEFSTGSLLANNKNLRRPTALRRREHVLHAAGRREALAVGDELAAVPGRAPDDGQPLEEVGRAAVEEVPPRHVARRH
jgi:ABC-type amino acid transport substrate-binding protein